MNEEQIRRLMEHDPERGSRALFDTYYSYVYAIVCRKLLGTGTREDVEECVADVFFEVMQRIGDIQEGALRSYIGTAARNRALNECRRIGARPTVPLEEERFQALPSGEDVAAQAEASEQARALLAAIESLGEPDASILIYKYYYDQNAQQIGRRLGIRPVTVRSRCSRALRRLRELLKEERWEVSYENKKDQKPAAASG